MHSGCIGWKALYTEVKFRPRRGGRKNWRMGGFRVAFRSGGGGEGVTIGGVRGSRVAFRGGGGCGKNL